MSSDMEILRRAYHMENDPRDWRAPGLRNWESYQVGAGVSDIRRMKETGYIVPVVNGKNEYGGYVTRYKLTDKGKDFIFASNMEREFARVPAKDIIEAMDLIVGFDDVKQTIARAIERQKRTHFLLEGPPACAKSLMLDGVRSSVPGSYPVFGSRTSAAGLSDALFEHQPRILLMDEADKMRSECFSILLALMENGEILETKARKTRGIHLETMVIAACNSSKKFPPEFLSRFALHINFPQYTREEFIDVCRGFLTKTENCPVDVAETIAAQVHDYKLGDVRKTRGVWQVMQEPTQEEIHKVIQMMLKYGKDGQKYRAKLEKESRLPGI